MTLQEGQQVTVNAIQALKGNPLCLTILLLVVALSLIAYYRESAAQEQRSRMVTDIIERCMAPAKR